MVLSPSLGIISTVGVVPCATGAGKTSQGFFRPLRQETSEREHRIRTCAGAFGGAVVEHATGILHNEPGHIGIQMVLISPGRIDHYVEDVTLTGYVKAELDRMVYVMFPPNKGSGTVQQMRYPYLPIHQGG
jgi:hypothetical protein